MRQDFVSSSCIFLGRRGTSVGGEPDGTPVKKHLSSLLRDGSSPSSLTAFVITRMTSSSAFSLALEEADDGKRAGSATEPDNSSASEATRERLSSSSLSLTPNEITSLAAAEGYWSSWVKRTECSLCDSEACGHWADASSLVTGCSNTLPRSFFLTGPWEEENGRARGAESLSGMKAILEGREARLKLSQWEQSATLSTASAWDFPKHDTHSAWVSSACRGDLHVYNDGAAFATTPFEICSFRGSVDRRRMAAGMTESVSWALREVQSGCWGISTADPGVSEETAKKGVCRWREEIGVAVATTINWLIFLS